jgi:S1-C subfamily serine protease
MRTGWKIPVLMPAVLALATSRGVCDEKADREGEIRESVVKVSASLRSPDLLRPWTKSSPQEVSGSGAVIEGRRILTNAHVVLYASQIFVESSQSGEKRAATVESISPGMDLAVLKLEDESFFEGRPPLKRTTELPDVKKPVLVYGYPVGGSSLSITQGIVSRIEFTGYNQGVSGVRVQVDAALNPGNSGGPALIDNEMIGLAFSGLRQADNIGYIIPSEEIDLFLKDVADGHYDGKPAMQDQLQTLENDALRGFLGLDRKASGMVVHAPDRDDADYPLKEWDLITKIGDHEVDNVGMVRLKDGLRLRFQYLVQKLTDDGKLPLEIVRKGETLKIGLPVSNRHPKLIESLRGRYPSYFVFGPLVFTAATSDLVSGVEQRLAASLSRIASPLATRRDDEPEFEGEELVVIPAPMFPHRLDVGYSSPIMKVVKAINGVPIRNLRHLVETLRDSKDKYLSIRFADHASESIVFNRQEILAATDEILTDNGVRQQASDDLRAVWEDRK